MKISGILVVLLLSAGMLSAADRFWTGWVEAGEGDAEENLPEWIQAAANSVFPNGMAKLAGERSRRINAMHKNSWFVPGKQCYIQIYSIEREQDFYKVQFSCFAEGDFLFYAEAEFARGKPLVIDPGLIGERGERGVLLLGVP